MYKVCLKSMYSVYTQYKLVNKADSQRHSRMRSKYKINEHRQHLLYDLIVIPPSPRWHVCLLLGEKNQFPHSFSVLGKRGGVERLFRATRDLSEIKGRWTFIELQAMLVPRVLQEKARKLSITPLEVYTAGMSSLALSDSACIEPSKDPNSN